MIITGLLGSGDVEEEGLVRRACESAKEVEEVGLAGGARRNQCFRTLEVRSEVRYLKNQCQWQLQ